MTKKYSCSPTLLIVESPTKCKKIEEFLGPGYVCLACFGHIRELNSLEDINKQTFEANYQVILSKKQQLKKIEYAIKNASDIIIATDNDREGEAIGWHICQVFGLDINKTKRIIFHEITESIIKKSIANPVKLDLNIIDAQQTRQILDLIVGFEISPVLWKYIYSPLKKPLSAGRCQTPTLKLIYDNQKDINNSISKKVFKTTGYFKIQQFIIPFILNKEFEEEQDITEFLNNSISFHHVLNCSEPIKKFVSPPKPFTTSTIQQVCSNELHLTPKETMIFCQSLYEKGYITYMRTDCQSYSKEFLIKSQQFIENTWSDKYVNKEYQNLITDNDNKAHEAIRPTNISLVNLETKTDLSVKEKKIYLLIWENTIESLMTSCSYFSIKANISGFNNNLFVNVSDQILFPGWKIIKNKFNMENKEYQYFSKIIYHSNIPVSYSKIISNIYFLQSKTYFSEARIIQLLEQKGIGRPSTYASLVTKIQEREYVKKKDIKGTKIECKNFELENGVLKEIIEKKEFGNEKGKLVLQPLGKNVLEFLENHFEEIFNYDFTRDLENELDLIAVGYKNKVEVCNEYYNKVILLLNKLNCNNSLTTLGNNFINFEKEIIAEKNENKKEKLIEKEKELENQKKCISPWEYKGMKLNIKKGKFGLYAKWGNNTKSLKKLGNRPIENIHIEEVLRILEN